jgi:hypothetical protein
MKTLSHGSTFCGMKISEKKRDKFDESFWRNKLKGIVLFVA